MKLETQISGYYLRKQGEYYIFSDENSRDVFYFNKSSEKSSFPFKFSLYIYSFEDKLMSYICSRLSCDQLDETKTVFYLKLLFKRLITYNEFDIYKIRTCILDNSGKLNYALASYCLRIFDSIDDRPWEYIFVNTPYSDLYNHLYFSCVQINIFYSRILKNSQKITRVEFENGLINDDLKFAYVEEYDINNEFFCENIIEESEESEFYQRVFFMFSNKKLMMVYVQ